MSFLHTMLRNDLLFPSASEVTQKYSKMPGFICMYIIYFTITRKYVRMKCKSIFGNGAFKYLDFGI